MWKELVISFYRENALIGEYFGGVDEKYDQIKKESNEHNSVVKKANNFAQIELNEGDGARIYFRYTKRFEASKCQDVEIYSKNFLIVQNGGKIKILDADTITLLKYLRRKGISLRIPNTSLIVFNDMIINFPTLCCNSLRIADIVITAIKELCQAWSRNRDNRLISFGLMINLTDNAGHISFAGHINDFAQMLGAIPKLSDVTFEEWVEAIYQENNKFKLGGNCPEKFRLIHGDVVCFERFIVHPNKIKRIWMENTCVHAQFNMSKEDREELIQHKIISIPFYRIIQDRCNKCGKDYLQCSCVKFIDEDVSDEVVKADLLGLIWTNRNAFYKDGQI